MLPEVLSNGLCSLNPQVDRLCMVCEMTVSSKGRLTGYKFYEAVMSSHARLTYTKVWHILQGDQDLREQYAPLVKHLEELHNLYKVLDKAREETRWDPFESEEAKFIFNAERRIERIEQTQRNDAHKLIEECMILANISAARFVEKPKNRHCSVFTTSRAPKRLPLSVQCWRSWGWNCRAVTSRNRATMQSYWNRLPIVLMQKCCKPCFALDETGDLRSGKPWSLRSGIAVLCALYFADSSLS